MHHLFRQGVSHDGCGRIRAHATRIGAGVAVANGLVVLHRNQRQGVGAIDQNKETGFFTLKKLLNDDLIACVPKSFIIHHGVDCGVGLFDRVTENHAFPGGQAIGFHNNRRAVLGYVGFCSINICEPPVSRCGYTCTGQQVFHMSLRAFYGRCCSARAEGLDSDGA